MRAHVADIESKKQEEQELRSEAAKLQGFLEALESQPTNAELESEMLRRTETVHKLKHQLSQCTLQEDTGAAAGLDRKSLEEILSTIQSTLKKRKRQDELFFFGLL